MASFSLTPVLRSEYESRFANCMIRPDRRAEVEGLVAGIERGEARYRAVADPLGIPWQVVGAIHCMETGLRFTRHLHNGDPLTARTVRVPAGRPLRGSPPFDWETSARDALELEGLPRWSDWSIPGMLYKLEGYNGWGYRRWHPSVPTPYLWSCSNHYERGKYVADGKWDADAVSKQCGAAVLLRRMLERGRLAELPAPAAPLVATPGAPPPLIPYYDGGPEQRLARAFQEFLNTLPGIAVDADGKPGERTSDATRRALGHYLVGDPREARG